MTNVSVTTDLMGVLRSEDGIGFIPFPEDQYQQVFTEDGICGQFSELDPLELNQKAEELLIPQIKKFAEEEGATCTTLSLLSGTKYVFISYASEDGLFEDEGGKDKLECPTTNVFDYDGGRVRIVRAKLKGASAE